MDAGRGLSSIVTTEAIQLNQTFPFVTINNFEVFARQARIASKAEVMSLSLHVEADQLQAFNAYAPSHAQEWLAASQMLNNDYEGTDAEIEMIPTLPFVYDTDVDIVTGEQSIAPTTTRAEVAWQISPVVKNGFLLMSNLIGITTANPDDNEVVSSFEVVRTTQGKTGQLGHAGFRKYRTIMYSHACNTKHHKYRADFCNASLGHFLVGRRTYWRRRAL